MGRETYTKREDFFFPYPLPGAPLAPGRRLHPHTSSSEMPVLGCVSLTQLRFSTICLNLTAWFSSLGLLLVTHLLYPTALIMLSCLLITTWQLVKAHGVTRNEPKIPGICYMQIIKVIRWDRIGFMKITFYLNATWLSVLKLQVYFKHSRLNNV